MHPSVEDTITHTTESSSSNPSLPKKSFFFYNITKLWLNFLFKIQGVVSRVKCWLYTFAMMFTIVCVFCLKFFFMMLKKNSVCKTHLILT